MPDTIRLMMKKLPAKLATRPVCASRLFKIDAVKLRFDNGVETEYERIGGITDGNAVMIIPIMDDGRLLFISEYSVGTERYELVFPKGRIDPGETSIDAAQRELREETGFRAAELTPWQSVTVAPGYASFMTDLWYASGLSHAPLAGDEPEPLETVILSLDEALGEVDRGALTEARSILGVYLVKNKLADST